MFRRRNRSPPSSSLCSVPRFRSVVPSSAFAFGSYPRPSLHTLLLVVGCRSLVRAFLLSSSAPHSSTTRSSFLLSLPCLRFGSVHRATINAGTFVGSASLRSSFLLSRFSADAYGSFFYSLARTLVSASRSSFLLSLSRPPPRLPPR